MKRLLGTVGTITVHLSVLVPLFLHSCTHKSPPPKHPVEVQSGNARDMKLRGQQSLATGLACGGETYKGVGIYVFPWDHRVLEVGPGTPAERAGIQQGDIILNDEELLGPDRHEVGTVLSLQVKRGLVVSSIDVTVEIICREY
jgi:hypothetical protein